MISLLTKVLIFQDSENGIDIVLENINIRVLISQTYICLQKCSFVVTFLG